MSDTAPFPIINGQYKMDKEPIVRIGVVLEEDDKTTQEFRVPAAGYKLTDSTGKTLADAPVGVMMTVVAEGNKVRLTGDGASLGSIDILRLVPPEGTEPRRAGDGTQVTRIVAGRGFHWHKHIDQTLSHVLEFRAAGGHVIMVNELPIETYLTGVITGEMSNECPIEFMKAQAVAARSWLLGQPRVPHPGKPFLWCNDDCCQRYQGTGGWSETARRAIAECRGQALITASNHYCDARYSKSTGGFSEDADFIWGYPIEGLVSIMDAPADSEIARFNPLTEENIEEYLRGDWLKKTDVFSSPNVVPEETITKYLGRVDEAGNYFRWEKIVTQDTLRESLSKRGGIEDLDTVLDLRTGPRGKGGRQAYMTVVYTSTDGTKKEHRIVSDYSIRAAMAMEFLYSSCFIADITRDDNGAIKQAHLYGGGWGHGAGLCQIGGLGRALKGQKYDEILLAYYTGVRLEGLYE